ncbi:MULTISPECIES: hypothetical protein [Nocardia]|uniref:hypothetical protein n=1 Tax=Nocardia TaxID=1817 RepID=UPI00245409A3|nr:MULTISPECIES: hypothetical protein [Nocardia]
MSDPAQALAEWTAAMEHSAPIQPSPTIIPTWLWDGLEQEDDALFHQLRDAGKIVRNQTSVR